MGLSIVHIVVKIYMRRNNNMTNNKKLIRNELEAIECLKSNTPLGGYSMLQESVDMAVQALEKQISKNPYHISQVDDNDNANVECPMCHAKADYAVNAIKKGYCWNCGQKLDWEDDDE